jgi:hypothetical protein
MGTDIFDPDNDTIPDFCRDVLGRKTPLLEMPQEEQFSDGSLLIFIFGLLVGLVIGFSLAVFANATILLGS